MRGEMSQTSWEVASEVAITSELRTSKQKKTNELEFSVASELGDRKRDFANELAVANERRSRK